MTNSYGYQKKMAADVHSDQYPCTPLSWFSRHKISRLNFDAIDSIIDRHCDRHRQLKVLDIGCGNGLWSFGLFEGHEITGIELNQRLLSYAKINSSMSSSRFDGKLLSDWVDRPGAYDFGLSIGVLEFLDLDGLQKHLSLLVSNVKQDGRILLVFSLWRQFSACYLPWIHRGGYKACCRVTGAKISDLRLSDIVSLSHEHGLTVVDGGGINPYPSKIWSMAQPYHYVTRNMKLSHWYYQQFLVLKKGVK